MSPSEVPCAPAVLGPYALPLLSPRRHNPAATPVICLVATALLPCCCLVYALCMPCISDVDRDPRQRYKACTRQVRGTRQAAVPLWSGGWLARVQALQSVAACGNARWAVHSITVWAEGTSDETTKRNPIPSNRRETRKPQTRSCAATTSGNNDQRGGGPEPECPRHLFSGGWRPRHGCLELQPGRVRVGTAGGSSRCSSSRSGKRAIPWACSRKEDRRQWETGGGERRLFLRG